jgi:hypothetical protein
MVSDIGFSDEFAILAPILALLGANPIAMAQQSGLIMGPSKITDFPGNNAKAIQVQVSIQKGFNPLRIILYQRKKWGKRIGESINQAGVIAY